MVIEWKINLGKLIWAQDHNSSNNLFTRYSEKLSDIWYFVSVENFSSCILISSLKKSYGSYYLTNALTFSVIFFINPHLLSLCIKNVSEAYGHYIPATVTFFLFPKNVKHIQHPVISICCSLYLKGSANQSWCIWLILNTDNSFSIKSKPLFCGFPQTSIQDNTLFSHNLRYCF